MKINVQNLSFSRWIAICNLLHRSNAIEESKKTKSPCMLINNSDEVFSEYHFFSEKQTFNPLPLIDIMLFLRSLTNNFWVKCYYIQALNCLRKKERFVAKKFMLLALNVYLSKQDEESKEYICGQIMKGSLIYAD